MHHLKWPQKSPWIFCTVVWFLTAGCATPTRIAEPAKQFQAGAYALDITPEKLPVHVNGGFLDRTDEKITDRLHARSLVLDDGATRIAIVVVDSCMLPRELIDQAKQLARERTGILPDHILVSATHTHSAPAAMGALGSDADLNYAPQLPALIAQSIEQALKQLEPAKIGWTVTNDFEHTHCRRWIYRSDKVGADPFGNQTVRANMHPGYENPQAIGPSGPVDPSVSLLSVQARNGRPLALLANYSMHYYGATPVSADYYGRFADKMSRLMGADDGKPAFVAMMSQGTSGDQMWMDYGQAQKNPGLEAYSEAIAQAAYEACQSIEYRDWVPLAMAEGVLSLHRRTPDDQRLSWAKKIVETMQGRAPRTIPEVYAREAVYLHDEPVRELKLQAIRIGDLGITAIPNEVFALTGLKLKEQSPLRPTFNIGLANGSEGYIPPPEQHALGGYTTWPARTAALEVEAEPKIVETELRLLERVSGSARRKPMAPSGPYPKAVLDSKPIAYWRLNEMSGQAALDATGNQHEAAYENGVAFYLDGPQSSNFCGAETINRCAHFAGGRLRSDFKQLGETYSVEFFFWNGFPNSARGVTGYLYSRTSSKPAEESGEDLFITGTNHSPGVLAFCNSKSGRVLTGATLLRPRTWHHAVLVRDKKQLAVYLDGNRNAELSGECEALPVTATRLFIGGRQDNQSNFEGKLDEISVYNRALSVKEIAGHEMLSGLAEAREAESRLQDQRVEGLPLPPSYAQTVLNSKPVAYWRMSEFEGSRILDSTDHRNDALAEENVLRGQKSPSGNLAAAFSGARIKAAIKGLKRTYSVVLWFWNEVPNESRPVTGYMFSRGPEWVEGAPGDHLGIGGTHDNHMGQLIVFNGNQLNQVLAGTTVIEPKTWNHVALVREGKTVKAYLNGDPQPEIAGELAAGFDEGVEQVFIGGRNDNFANFSGRIDELAIYDRALGAPEVVEQFKASGQPHRAKPAAFQPEPPRSPADSLQTIQIPPGFEIELVAAEPLVKDPVAIDWGADGRLWVVEMADYPMGIDGKMKPGGRIRILEDTDGDGKLDKSTLFLDGVNFPNGIATWRKGVLVTAAPEIFYAEAGESAGSPVRRQTLFRGFAEGNLQLRVNGLRWGLDNWVYCANGWSGGIAESLKTGARIDMRGRDIRLRPDEGIAQGESGVSQFGRERDDWGNWFGVDNSHPLFHYVLSDHYLHRNPHVAAPESKVQVIVPSNPRVYPARPPEKRYHSFGEAGHFTSACGPMIYRDELLFGANQGPHMFVCEPFHNLVHHELLSDAGVTFSARRAEDEQEREFLTSRDRWFRPVMARTGPDGALWVVDMYRSMIEHPEFLPPGGRAELEPFYRSGQEQGRLYRIYPKGKRPGPVQRLDAMSTAQLVATFDSRNGWQRDKAQQLLIWQADPGAPALLEEFAGEGNHNPLARLHALCTLDGLDALKPQLLIRAIEDEHPGLRREAVRLAEVFANQNESILQSLSKLVADPSPKVRLQLACTLGQFDAPDAGEALGRLLTANHEDRYIVAAVLSSASNHCARIASHVADGPASALNSLAESLLNLAFALGERQAIARLLQKILSPTDGIYAAEQMRVFARFTDSLSRNKTSLEELASVSDDLSRELGRAPAIFEAARKVAVDANEVGERRAAAVSLLGREPSLRTQDLALLASLFAPQVQGDLKKTAVKSLGALDDPSVPGTFASAWRAQLPEVRAAMLDELLSREAWAFDLLSRVEKGEIAPHDIDAPRRDRLMKYNSERVKQLAQKLLSASASPSRQKVIQDFRAALALPGEATRGRAVFDRLCSSCHQVASVGLEVGPDLRSIGNRSSETLLASILDPNGAVDPRYLAYTCQLSNEEEVYGIILSESANSITMKTIGAATRSILRREIVSLSSANMSLMPEGFETGLTKQDMADLIRYIQSL